MTPMQRGALEAALSATGVEADVHADGRIIDRYDGKPFTDQTTIFQSLVLADLLLGSAVGDEVTFGKKVLEDLAHNLGFDGFDGFYETKAADLHERVTPFLEWQMVGFALRIIDAEWKYDNRGGRS